MTLSTRSTPPDQSVDELVRCELQLTSSGWHPARVLTVLFSMIGLRLDRSPLQALAMMTGIGLSILLSFWLTKMTWENVLGVGLYRPPAGPAVAYLVGTWALYYIGHGLVYKLNIHRALRRRFGAERALSIYTACLGLVYFNVIWCQLPFLAVYQGTIALNVAPLYIFIASLTLFMLSFGIKVWATLHLGVGGYYYEDMFLEERSSGGPMVHGPYALMSDPMYSVGYFPIYSGALFARSMEGLVAAVVFHVSIYLFNLIIERPFVQRMYGGG